MKETETIKKGKAVKKSVIAKMLAIGAFSLISVFAFAGCGKPSEEAEKNNSQIYSIYEMAQQNGYDGTYEEWLASIKGENGADGDNVELCVKDGYIKWKNTKDTTWKNLISIEDIKGSKGDSGINTYSIQYFLGGKGSNSEDNPHSFNKNTYVSLESPSSDLYDFAGWYTTPDFSVGTGLSYLNGTQFSENISLYAKWTKKSNLWINDLHFILNSEGKYTLESYDGFSASVEMPDYLYEEGDITEIGRLAFAYNSSLRNIVISPSVKSIGEFAFHRCCNLTEVRFGKYNTGVSKLQTIGESAFRGTNLDYRPELWGNNGKIYYSNSSLYKIIGSTELISIGDLAFQGYNKIDEVEFMSPYLKYIGRSAFRGNKFEKIKFNQEMSDCELGGWAFRSSEERTISTIDLTGFKTIGDFCFGGFEGSSSGKANISVVLIPNTVKEISEDAFSYCRIYRVINESEYLGKINSSSIGASESTTGSTVEVLNFINANSGYWEKLLDEYYLYSDSGTISRDANPRLVYYRASGEYSSDIILPDVNDGIIVDSYFLWSDLLSSFDTSIEFRNIKKFSAYSTNCHNLIFTTEVVYFKGTSMEETVEYDWDKTEFDVDCFNTPGLATDIKIVGKNKETVEKLLAKLATLNNKSGFSVTVQVEGISNTYNFMSLRVE